MITFLLGDIGHGKSTKIINNLKEDASNHIHSFLIVPEQETLACERVIAQNLPSSAQLYIEVLSFSRLANRVFRKYGGLRYNYATRSDKNLVMYKTICELKGHSLKEFKNIEGSEHTFVKLFLDAIGELKSYGVTPQELQKAIKALEQDSDSDKRLIAKLNDIVLIWGLYENTLHKTFGFDDSYDDIISLEKILSSNDNDFFKNCNVYFDSFYGFTSTQLNIIKVILEKAKNVTFAFDCPFDARENSLQYSKIIQTKNRIFALCDKLEKKIESFDTDYKHKNDAIKFLGKSLWDFSATPIKKHSGVFLRSADGEFEECDYVATRIKQYILSGKGIRYNDIAIIVRDVEKYRGIIDYALKKYDIPHFISASVDIMSIPAVKMVFCALRAISTYRPEDIIAYVKCSYLDIDETELNEFENYIFRWNIYGKRFKDLDFWVANPDGYLKSMNDAQKQSLALVHSAREKILSKLEILEKAFACNEPIDKCCDAIFKFLEAHDTKNKIEAEIPLCQKQEAYELAQVWNILLKTLDSLALVCGNSVVGIDDFITLLNYALSETEIATIPPGNDVVVIGDANTIRTKNIKHTFILGANEGVFPADVQDDGFFTDADKIALEGLSTDNIQITLSAKSDTRSDDELFNFKNAICSASNTATIMCLKVNSAGKKLQPSIAFTRIKELLVGIKSPSVSKQNPLDKIYTKQAALEYLSQTSTELGTAVRECLGLSDVSGNQDYTNDELQINEQDSKELFGNNLVLSKSSIESFASCKFKYYCSYVLNLNSSKRISFASNDVGNLIHYILEKFFLLCKEKNYKVSELSDAELEKFVNDILAEYISLICYSSKLSKRLEFLLNKIKKNIFVYLKNIINEFSQSEFVPEYFELAFRDRNPFGPAPLKIELENGAQITLVGVADRVDVYRPENQDKIYVRVVDYKSGNESASLDELKNGFGLQMFIYLFALCKMDDCEFKRRFLDGKTEIVPSGIMYFPLQINKGKINHDLNLDIGEIESAERQFLEEKIARSGFFVDDFDLLNAQDKKQDGSILPKKEVKVDKSGNVVPDKNSPYISYATLFEQFDVLKDAISQIGNEIFSGAAFAKPKKHGDKSPCKYCEFKEFCRSKERIVK